MIAQTKREKRLSDCCKRPSDAAIAPLRKRQPPLHKKCARQGAHFLCFVLFLVTALPCVEVVDDGGDRRAGHIQRRRRSCRHIPQHFARIVGHRGRAQNLIRAGSEVQVHTIGEEPILLRLDDGDIRRIFMIAVDGNRRDIHEISRVAAGIHEAPPLVLSEAHGACENEEQRSRAQHQRKFSHEIVSLLNLIYRKIPFYYRKKTKIRQWENF